MKTALITGAGGGLGKALCAAFRDDGYRVIGSDVEVGTNACDRFVVLDLTALSHDDTLRRDAGRRFREALGGDRLEVLVNNAATQLLDRFEAIELADWQATLAVNLTAPMLLSQLLLPELARAQGTIVNIGSIHATLTKPGFVAYATSKAALAGLTRAMAVDLGSRVRVVGLEPAAIDTDMLRAGFANRPDSLELLAAAHPAGRIGRPDEVAQAAVFLASPAAAFVSGTMLQVAGGIGARLHDPE